MLRACARRAAADWVSEVRKCIFVKVGFAALKVTAAELTRVDIGSRWAWVGWEDSTADTPLVVVGM